MGADSSKVGGAPVPLAGEDVGDDTGPSRRYPPISTRSLSVPASGVGSDNGLASKI